MPGPGTESNVWRVQGAGSGPPGPPGPNPWVQGGDGAGSQGLVQPTDEPCTTHLASGTKRLSAAGLHYGSSMSPPGHVPHKWATAGILHA